VFVVAFIVGTIVTLIAGLGFPLALVGGAAGMVLAFAGQFLIGLTLARRGRQSAPVDLSAGVPDPLSVGAYQQLPLAVRNAVVSRAVAQATGTTPDRVAAALPDMMGRTMMNSLASQREVEAIIGSMSAARIDPERYDVILQGEVALAAAAAMPPNDRARTIAERNLGQAVTPELMRTALLMTRFPLLDGLTLNQLLGRAVAGEMDLAFVVGSIRKVGEKHQQGLAGLQ